MKPDKTIKDYVRLLMRDSHARSMGRRSYFGGNAYNYICTWAKKANAVDTAKWIREGGGLARVVKGTHG